MNENEYMKTPLNALTKAQEELICQIIGDWYLGIKNNFVNYSDYTHSLGYAKEILKTQVIEINRCLRIESKILND